jgi:hypothetical protein
MGSVIKKSLNISNLMYAFGRSRKYQLRAGNVRICGFSDIEPCLGNVGLWPKLCRNQEILTRVVRSGVPRHSQSHQGACFQCMTYRTIDVCF